MVTEISLQQKQKEAVKMLGDKETVFYGGAKSGGKSFLVRAWNLMRAKKYPGTHHVIIRKTYPELHANHIKKFYIEYPELMSKYYLKHEKTIYLPNKSSIKFDYLHRPDDVYRYQGVEYDSITVDEITQHNEETFKILQGSLRSISPIIKPKMLLTGNPGGVGHGWVKRIFIDCKYNEYEDPKDFGFVQAFIYDNQALMKNDPTYIKRLESLPEKKRMAYLEGRWDVFEGQFFEMWNPDIHIVKDFDFNSVKKVYISGDYGYRAPSAVMWYGETDQGIVGYKELYGTGMDYYQLSQRMNAMTTAEERQMLQWCVFDTSIWASNQFGGRSGGDILSDLFPMKKASKDRVIGWTKLKQMLSTINKYDPPKLRFTKDCKNLIETLPLCVYDDDPMEKKEDLHKDCIDHCLVGNTMIRMGDGGFNKLKTIKIGDMVATPDGPKKVLDFIDNGVRDLWELELSDGRILQGTAIHKIYTQEGKKLLHTLRYGDIVEIWNTKESNIAVKSTKDLLVDVLMEGLTCIGRFGLTIMARFLRVIMSIILMVIQKTIKLKTYVLLQPANIHQSTQKNGGALRGIEKKVKQLLKGLDRLPVNGTDQKKVKNGIRKQGKKHGKKEKHMSCSAWFVKRNTEIKSKRQSFAQIIVSQHGDEGQALMMRRELVQSVKRHLLPISILKTKPVHVIAVRNLKRKQNVYDLTVEDAHKYYANDILVSNSSDQARYMAMAYLGNEDGYKITEQSYAYEDEEKTEMQELIEEFY